MAMRRFDDYTFASGFVHDNRTATPANEWRWPKTTPPCYFIACCRFTTSTRATGVGSNVCPKFVRAFPNPHRNGAHPEPIRCPNVRNLLIKHTCRTHATGQPRGWRPVATKKVLTTTWLAVVKRWYRFAAPMFGRDCVNVENGVVEN